VAVLGSLPSQTYVAGTYTAGPFAIPQGATQLALACGVSLWASSGPAVQLLIEYDDGAQVGIDFHSPDNKGGPPGFVCSVPKSATTATIKAVVHQSVNTTITLTSSP
jgi:hypothetical protein